MAKVSQDILEEAVCLIVKYVNDEYDGGDHGIDVFTSNQVKQKAFESAKLLKKVFNLSYPKMILSRMFPAPREITVEDLLSRDVFATSTSDVQSWSSDLEMLMKYYGLNHFYDSSNPSLIYKKDKPTHVVAQTKMPQSCILLDINNDFTRIIEEVFPNDEGG